MPSEVEKFLSSGHKDYENWQREEMPNLNTWLQRQRDYGITEPSYPPVNRGDLELAMQMANPKLQKFYTGWPYKAGRGILDIILNPPIMGDRVVLPALIEKIMGATGEQL